MKNRIIVLVFISLSIFLLDKVGAINPVKNIAEKIFVMPVTYVFSGAADSLENNFRVLTFWKSGEERIKNLEQKVWEIESLRAKNLELGRENEILRNQANVQSGKTATKVLANVLEVSEFMVLDAGENRKVKTGDTVVMEGFLIGIITKITPNRSFVRLTTDADSQINVKVGTVRGMAVGQFNTSVILDKVAQDEPVLKGDPVFTSGEGEANIPNLLIGTVGEIKSRDTDLFKKAEILLPLDFKKPDKVLVIINEN